ncbi:MAG TPA: FHA domain-containing protein [Gemmataceae bacterium]|nr:FHA domain-containing protein [Gemmataceae bacterium]
MLAQLVALSDGGSILLDKPIMLLGRHPECDIQIDSRKVSRRHCCIAMVSDYLVVRDLGSTNGIRINGQRVTEGRLRTGDELTIGNCRYQVRLSAPEPGSRPAAVQAARAQPARAAPSAAPARPVVPVSPPAALDDDMLEACEEPVPLAEPVASLPQPIQAAEPPPDKIVAPPAKPPPSMIVPDQLELAPSSEAAPPAPPSSHQPSA